MSGMSSPVRCVVLALALIMTVPVDAASLANTPITETGGANFAIQADDLVAASVALAGAPLIDSDRVGDEQAVPSVLLRGHRDVDDALRGLARVEDEAVT